ncbi:MAG: hypothetical protein P1U53_06360 [Sulfitobacter sp.]|nr:hypothetical protein [Sulfitobacter sp.]
MTRRLALALLAGAATLGGVLAFGRKDRGGERAAEIYARPLPAPDLPLSVYHVGHSLVGRNMPTMLAQLMGDGYRFESQLGWGTPLRAHWEPEVEINGFEVENDHPRFRPATEAVGSGEYDAIVLTEMVEIRDAIRYHDSARYLARWADLARQSNPETRLYLYETWHHIDDPEGWLTRLDVDFDAAWQQAILHPSLARSEAAIHLIPAGQVMAALVREIETRGPLPGLAGVADLFARNDDGTVDTIHFNDLGAYLVALVHYAVLTHRSPVGLPHRLTRADGTAADAPGAEAAALMQEVTWRVVRDLPQTGVST